MLKDFSKKALIIFLLSIYCIEFQTSTINTAEASDVKVIVLVANGCGHTYFDFKDEVESWGWEVTTAGLTSLVSSCGNKEPKSISVDIRISSVDNETLSTYDCLFIPSGGHHENLEDSDTVVDLISNAYELGLILATLCIGIRVLNQVDGIVNGTKIASFGMTNLEILNAGGIVTDEDVVTDNKIITGGGGGGSGRHDLAPTIELCNAIDDFIVEEQNAANYEFFMNILTLSGIFGVPIFAIIIIAVFVLKQRKNPIKLKVE